MRSFAYWFLRHCPRPRANIHCSQGLPWNERYIVKANAWIAIFSFIGNYWRVKMSLSLRFSRVRIPYPGARWMLRV